MKLQITEVAMKQSLAAPDAQIPTTPASNNNVIAATTTEDGITNNNSNSYAAEEGDDEEAIIIRNSRIRNQYLEQSNAICVEETTARYAMAESLRSLPGAFRVTPNMSSSANSNSSLEEENQNQEGVEDEQQERRRQPSPAPPVPEHDIAVEAYAVHDDTANNSNNNNISLGNGQLEDQEDLENCYQVQPTTAQVVPVAHAQVIPTIYGIDKKRFKHILLFIGIVIVVALSVVLGTNNIGSNDQQQQQQQQRQQDDNKNVEITEQQLQDEVVSIMNERRQKLLETISPLVQEGTFDQFNTHTTEGISPTGNKYIDDRVATLEWLLQDLRRRIVLNLDTVTITNSSSTALPMWRVRQRYVLALLYISTTSNTNIIGTQWSTSTIITSNDTTTEVDGEKNDKEWYRRLNFLSDTNECEWYTSYTTCNVWGTKPEDCPEAYVETKGVDCNEMGEVTSIILYDNNLGGTLPPELSILTEMAVMNFVTNKISGEIPSSLGKLSKLQQLWLSDNCLTGTIPSSFDQLTKLVQSSYQANYLTGNLNGFCNGTVPREGITFIAAECGVCPYYDGDTALEAAGVDWGVPQDQAEQSTSLSSSNVECDCCICCDPVSTMCCSSEGSYLFPANVVFNDCPAS